MVYSHFWSFPAISYDLIFFLASCLGPLGLHKKKINLVFFAQRYLGEMADPGSSRPRCANANCPSPPTSPPSPPSPTVATSPKSPGSGGGRSGRGAMLKVCGKCRIVRYCSRACQSAAWPYHRDSCTMAGSVSPPPPPPCPTAAAAAAAAAAISSSSSSSSSASSSSFPQHPQRPTTTIAMESVTNSSSSSSSSSSTSATGASKTMRARIHAGYKREALQILGNHTRLICDYYYSYYKAALTAASEASDTKTPTPAPPPKTPPIASSSSSPQEKKKTPSTASNFACGILMVFTGGLDEKAKKKLTKETSKVYKRLQADKITCAFIPAPRVDSNLALSAENEMVWRNSTPYDAVVGIQVSGISSTTYCLICIRDGIRLFEPITRGASALARLRSDVLAAAVAGALGAGDAAAPEPDPVAV